MTNTNSAPLITDALRNAIISKPEVILDDRDLMNALITENDRSMGENVIDMRGAAMDRLEARLDRLENTHRSVVAAAHDNMAGMQQIHRSVLQLLDTDTFEQFLAALDEDVAHILRLDAIRLLMEHAVPQPEKQQSAASGVLNNVAPGTISGYLRQNKASVDKDIVLRSVRAEHPQFYSASGQQIKSEACLKLEGLSGGYSALLLMGSSDPTMFHSQQGTDLLAFFAGAASRALRHLLG